MAVDKNIPACLGQLFNLPAHNPGLGRQDQFNIVFHFHPGPVDQNILSSAADVNSQDPVKILLVQLGQFISQALLFIISPCLHYITVNGIMHSCSWGAFQVTATEISNPDPNSNPDPVSSFSG